MTAETVNDAMTLVTAAAATGTAAPRLVALDAAAATPGADVIRLLAFLRNSPPRPPRPCCSPRPVRKRATAN
jgi:hypothetical protein